MADLNSELNRRNKKLAAVRFWASRVGCPIHTTEAFFKGSTLVNKEVDGSP